MRPTTLSTINAIESSMGQSSVRGSALAHNLANVNTPGYKRIDLDFAAALDAALHGGRSPRLALATTATGHRAARPSASAGPQIVEAAGTTLRNDGNNVDIEAEMAYLSQNAIYYQALVKNMNSKLSLLRLAITEGRR